MDFQSEYRQKRMTPREAAQLIRSNDVIMSTMNGAPYTILNAIGERWPELENVKFYSELLYMPVRFLQPAARGHIDVISCFQGAAERSAGKQGVFIDSLPYQIHQHEEMILESIKPNVALIHVTSFDADGYCTFGPNPVGGTTVVACAERVIAQVNDQNPRFAAPEGKVHISRIDAIVEVSEPMPQIIPARPSEIDRRIAAYIVEQIENGSTIQLGIGGIANAVGYYLENHRDLGIHTEMYTESMVALMKRGVVNNSRKTLYQGRSVIGFAQGTQIKFEWCTKPQD